MRKFLFLVIPIYCFIISCKKNDFQNYVSPEKAILSFKVSNQLGQTIIKRTLDSSIVRLTMPYGTSLNSIKPSIIVSDGASIFPASNEAVDFSKNGSYTYTVTAKNGSNRAWTVYVEINSVPFEGLTLIPNTGEWNTKVVVYSDDLYNNYLTRYTGWNGGDGCYSTLLPDSSLLWTFQDSFFGSVTEARARIDNTFVRNAAILQKNRSLSSFVQLNPGSEKNSQTWVKYAGSNDEDDVYWPGRAHVYKNKVQVPMGHLKLNKSNGQLETKSIDVAVLSLPDLNIETIIKNVDTTKFGYDSGTFDDINNGYSYFYGTENGWLSTMLHVARVKGHDFASKWEYLTDNGWADRADNHSILNDVTQPNVFKEGNKYYLVSQQIIFGRDIYIFEASSPIGPWTNKRTLYKIPEKYDGKDILTYNASVHSGLSRLGELVISYNINPVDFWSNFNKPGSADRYRPFFVRIFNWK